MNQEWSLPFCAAAGGAGPGKRTIERQGVESVEGDRSREGVELCE